MRKKYQKVIKNDKCTQAIVFARVSSKRQKDEGVSLDVQMEAITKYCQEKGLKIIKDFSIDESSTRGDRKQYHEMLDFAQSCTGRVAIVVNYVDRLQRSSDDSYLINKLRKDGKIEVHFLKEGLIIHKDSKSTDLTFWNMHVLFANAQINNMIDKVKDSLNKNWAEGKWQGRAPLGYLNQRNEDNKAVIVTDPVRAPIIKRLYMEFATGLHTVTSIWHLAKELGLYSKAKNRKNCLVTRNTVYEILTNPFYYGEMCIKGNLMPHIYEPLVSKELFNLVQNIFVENGGHNRTNIKEFTKTTYIFRKLIHCKSCGCLITPEKKIKKNGKEYVYLRCGHSAKICNQGIVNENEIIRQLKQEVFAKLTLPSSVQEALKEQLLKQLNDISQLNTIFKSRITREINDLQTQGKNLFDFCLKGNFPYSFYESKKAEIDNQIKELEKSLEKYKTIDNDMKQNVVNVVSMAANISDIFDKATPDKKNQLLRLLITDCKLNGKRLEYRLKAPFDKLITCTDSQKLSQITMDNLDEFEKVCY